eukprot:m.38926 g.38926  ORF g.38926 m.38926 type:complete len:363 (+) comp9492_c0_seq1:91-1179(+)
MAHWGLRVLLALSLLGMSYQASVAPTSCPLNQFFNVSANACQDCAETHEEIDACLQAVDIDHGDDHDHDHVDIDLNTVETVFMMILASVIITSLVIVAAVYGYGVSGGLQDVNLGDHILLNLSIAQIGMMVFFLSLDPQYHVDTNSCKANALMLQFFMIATSTWSLAEGFHLYQLFVKILGVSESVKINLLICWGFAAMLSIIPFAIWTDDYSCDTICWIDQKSPANYFVFVPIFTTLVVNLVLLVFVLRSISKHSECSTKCKRKAAMIFSVSLGINYIFALLALVDEKNSKVWAWMFGVSFTLQALFILNYRCLHYPRIQGMINRAFGRWRNGRDSIVSLVKQSETSKQKHQHHTRMGLLM